MRPTPGLVGSTLSGSLVDGPGNRFVVFLQGCNFDCFNCHNPHTINRCDSCAVCLDACEPRALDLVDGLVVFDPARCTGCDLCLAVCPTDSSPMAVERTVDSLLDEIRRYAPFISGVTVSGGEPTLQLDFLVALLGGVKAELGLSTMVDSNGSLDVAGWRRLVPVLDGAMIDLKAMTPETHHRITGQDNAAVLSSIRFLHRVGRLHEVRLLVIEGLTDSDGELEAYAAFLGSLDPEVRLRLLAFRHHGVREHGRSWPETAPGTMHRVAGTLAGLGLGNVVLTEAALLA
jgi:pyruvate formate lyase activating enzyme